LSIWTSFLTADSRPNVNDESTNSRGDLLNAGAKASASVCQASDSRGVQKIKA
jgi:hypothetical protein